MTDKKFSQCHIGLHCLVSLYQSNDHAPALELSSGEWMGAPTHNFYFIFFSSKPIYYQPTAALPGAIIFLSQ